jgi:hypothetical protein
MDNRSNMDARLLISTSSFGRSGRQVLGLLEQAGCGVMRKKCAVFIAAVNGRDRPGAPVANTARNLDATILDRETSPTVPGQPLCTESCRGWT